MNCTGDCHPFCVPPPFCPLLRTFNSNCLRNRAVSDDQEQSDSPGDQKSGWNKQQGRALTRTAGHTELYHCPHRHRLTRYSCPRAKNSRSPSCQRTDKPQLALTASVNAKHICQHQRLVPANPCKTPKIPVAPGAGARERGGSTAPGPGQRTPSPCPRSADAGLHCIHWNQQTLPCDFWPLGIFLAICQGLPCDLLWRKQTQALTNENM